MIYLKEKSHETRPLGKIIYDKVYYVQCVSKKRVIQLQHAVVRTLIGIRA